jgi:GH43 family beta-xylosidase
MNHPKVAQTRLFALCLGLFFLLTGVLAPQQIAPTTSAFIQSVQAQGAETTFFNPIMRSAADPSIVYKDGVYYYTQTTGNNVTVWKSETISGVSKATSVVVWTPPATGAFCCNIWAPELYFSNSTGKWYIYFAADDGQSYEHHRLYVLESATADPQGAYTHKGKLYDGITDRYAIDGSVLEKPDGSLYLLWSGKQDSDFDTVQRLYIAPMSNPWTISGPRVLISTPTHAWETSQAPINEGPQTLLRNGKIHIVYAANASWTDDYAMGMLTNTDGNVLNPASWTKKATPVFAKTADVFGPAHGTFIKSPNGAEDWMLYNAAKYSGAGWDRNVQMQKFTWNADDTPNFGTPIPAGLSLPVPAGEGLTCSTCNIYSGWGSSASGTRVSGTWTINSATSANSTELARGWQHLFRGNVSTTNATVSADAKWLASGSGGGSVPKYGIYAAYQDSNNFVAVFLDRKARVMATYGVVNGVAQPWQNTNARIDFAQYHTLKVVKNGTTFQFYLDGSLKQTRSFNINNGQMGLVTENTRAEYQNVTVTTP